MTVKAQKWLETNLFWN